jgi:hypothetical protein
MNLSRLPRLPRLVLAWAAPLATGIGLGVLIHYLLYRLSLPLQPFIYVAF